MRDAFIISSYANTDEKMDILKECISQIKKFGADIILASHFSLPEEIQSLAEYYVYDANNSFIPKKYYARTTGLCSWFSMGDKIFYFYNDFHALPIVRNIKLGVSIAKHSGYDYFYYTESDNIFADEDFVKLRYIKNSMIANGKNICFLKNENPDGGHPAYVTSIFMGNTGYFLDKFVFPFTIMEWENTTYCNSLEVDFYRFFSQFREDIIEVNVGPSSYFSKSKINKSLVYLVNAALLYNERNASKPYIACCNMSPYAIQIEIFVNSVPLIALTLQSNGCWTYQLDISNITKVVIKNEGKIIFETLVDTNSANKLLENGRVR